MKRLGMIAFILVLVLCFAMPASAVKIFPYNMPLHDIVTWDRFDEEFQVANPENEAISVSWPEDVDYWNYDGDYWKYNLPDGDEFLFLKGVNVGHEDEVITYTYGEPIFEVWGTCAGTDGATNAMVVYIHSVLTGEGQVGRAAEFVLAPTCVRMGAWGNAIKAKLDLSGDGVLGSIGLLAGVCAEIVTPAGSLNGSIAVVEHEIVATEGLILGDFLYSANTLTFLQFALAGESNAVAEVDDHGQFFTINGLANAAGHMLSEGYVTLKGSVNDLKQMYLVLSRIEDGLGMGALGDELTLNDDSPLFRLYTTAAEAGAVGVNSALIRQVNTTASNNNEIEAFKVEVISDVKTGAWANAIFGRLDYVENGLAHGTGSAICAEISMPSVTAVIRGTYAAYAAELDMPTGCDLGGNPIAVFDINVWGGAETEFDDHGLLFDIEGVTTGALDFYYEAAVAFNNCDAFLKIRVGTTFYYIPLSDNQGGT